MHRALAVSAVLLALGGCVANKDWGSGPLTMSPRTKANFDKYLDLMGPLYFAVSVDGQHSGWNYCQGGINCGVGSPYNAIAYCESASKGVPCKIYAQGRTVVWGGHVDVADRPTTQIATVAPTVAAAVAPASPPVPPKPQDAAPASLGGDARHVEFTWGGIDGTVPGTIDVDHTTRKVTALLAKGKGLCSGSYVPTSKAEGMWTLDCADGTSASGTFRGLGEGKGLIGEGFDGKGNAVKYTVAGR